MSSSFNPYRFTKTCGLAATRYNAVIDFIRLLVCTPTACKIKDRTFAGNTPRAIAFAAAVTSASEFVANWSHEAKSITAADPVPLLVNRYIRFTVFNAVVAFNV